MCLFGYLKRKLSHCLNFLCFSVCVPYNLKFLQICSRRIFKSKNSKVNNLYCEITVLWKLTPCVLVQRHQPSFEWYACVIRVDVNCSEFFWYVGIYLLWYMVSHLTRLILMATTWEIKVLQSLHRLCNAKS